MSIAQILPYIAAAAGTLALLLYRSIYSRVVTLETTYHAKSDAEQTKDDLTADLAEHADRDETQFKAVQQALSELKHETQASFASLRIENNEKRTEMRNDFMNLRSESNAANARIYDLIDRKTQRRPR